MAAVSSGAIGLSLLVNAVALDQLLLAVILQCKHLSSHPNTLGMDLDVPVNQMLVLHIKTVPSRDWK